MTPEARIEALEHELALLKEQLEHDRREWHAAIARALTEMRREQHWREWRRDVAS